MVFIYAAITPGGKLTPLIQDHIVSLGELIRHGVWLMPNREWIVETIGM